MAERVGFEPPDIGILAAVALSLFRLRTARPSGQKRFNCLFFLGTGQSYRTRETSIEKAAARALEFRSTTARGRLRVRDGIDWNVAPFALEFSDAC